MPLATHLRLFGLATGVWFAFWVLGHPRYYRQYPTSWMALFCLALLPPICWWVCRVLRRSRRRKMTLAAWMAFYFTVPLFLYDYVYCGLYLGEGLGFLRTYWYLTIYYGIPWVVFPLAAHWVDRRPRAGRSPENP